MSSLIPPVVIRPSLAHKATLIFLHGLGDTGFGWSAALNSMRIKSLKIICPTANSIPVSLNDGFEMPAWYDMFRDGQVPAQPDKGYPTSGLRTIYSDVENARQNLNRLIHAEMEESSIGRERIFLGGFSQGGALALYTTVMQNINVEQKMAPLAGCIALSTYLTESTVPEYKRLKRDEIETHTQTPYLICHGDSDQIVSIDRGRKIVTDLKEIQISGMTHFHELKGVGHEGTPSQMRLVKKFIHECVPDMNSKNDIDSAISENR